MERYWEHAIVIDEFTEKYTADDYIDGYVDIFAIEAQQKREMRQIALAPQIPPAGLCIGKHIAQRARANLPRGCRKRDEEEET